MEPKSHPVENTVWCCLHQVANVHDAIVLVRTRSNRTIRRAIRVAERVRNHAVACLEADLRLETVRILCAEHLERNVRAVEQTCVIRAVTKIGRAHV